MHMCVCRTSQLGYVSAHCAVTKEQLDLLQLLVKLGVEMNVKAKVREVKSYSMNNVESGCVSDIYDSGNQHEELVFHCFPQHNLVLQHT